MKRANPSADVRVTVLHMHVAGNTLPGAGTLSAPGELKMAGF